MAFGNSTQPRRPTRRLLVPMASIGLGALMGIACTVMGPGAALAADGAFVYRGEVCSLGGGTTTNSFLNLTPSGNAQSSCHAGPDQPGPAAGEGATVFHDARCFTAAGVERQSVFVYTPSGGANAVCLANPGH